MIRPRRTFQDRSVQSAGRWDRIRSANRVRGWVRVISFFCCLTTIIVFTFSRIPQLPARQTIASKPVPVIESSQPFASDFQYLLGADEARELLPLDRKDATPESEEAPEEEAETTEQEIVEIDGELSNVEKSSDSSEESHETEERITLTDKSQHDVQPQNGKFEKDNPLDERSEDDIESGQQDAEAETIREASISKEGVVGSSDVGGTFDGKHLTLFPQITLPEVPIIQHYDSTQNYWPLHSILKERGWAYATLALPSRVTLWISRGSIPPRLKEGYQMLNSMGVSGCIGGAKSLQLECRRRLARLDGCDYDDLHIQPAQYNMLNLDDCRRFFADAEKPERVNQIFLSKPTYTFHGSGIRIHQGASGTLKHEFGACKTPKNTILMDYVANPATMMGGYKFDFRTYVLVASLKPQLVFYHDGFVRKSDRMFDLHSKDLNVHITNKVTQSKEDHFFNFTTLGAELHRELGLPVDHLDRYVRPRAQAVSRFLFQTTLVQPQPPRHVAGRFHLFGIDWLLDAKGQLHLLEGNGYPLVTHYHGIDLTPRIWEEMMDLILAIQTKPQTITEEMTVKKKFSFGGWKLVFNELEEMWEKAHGTPYNSCTAFGARVTPPADDQPEARKD